MLIGFMLIKEKERIHLSDLTRSRPVLPITKRLVKGSSIYYVRQINNSYPLIRTRKSIPLHGLDGGVFSNNSIVYYGAFLRKKFTLFSREILLQNSYIVDVGLGSKCASAKNYYAGASCHE